MATTTEHWTLHRQGRAALRAACDILAREGDPYETVQRLSDAELLAIARRPGLLGHRVRHYLARLQQPSAGHLAALRRAICMALEPDDEWAELSADERRQAVEVLMDFFDALASRDDGRARALLKLWLDEVGTDEAERMRAQLRDPGDCPVCGEKTYEEFADSYPDYDGRVRTYIVRHCDACGWQSEGNLYDISSVAPLRR